MRPISEEILEEAEVIADNGTHVTLRVDSELWELWRRGNGNDGDASEGGAA